VLPPGRHRIRIRSLRSPFGASTGFVSVYRLGKAAPNGVRPHSVR
jgi:hypothetical protein